jgi:CheY-like chemotaxis protein
MPDHAADAVLRGQRVLVVEDEALVAMELASVLRQQGCSVIGPAPSVARALALLDEQRPDVALLDLNLNGEPALAVAVALRDEGVPFVVVSGYGEAQSGEAELRHVPRVTKPMRHRELMRALAQVLSATPPS